MSPVGNTFLGRESEPRPDSEFTIFNLAIRLSKVEQLAFFPLVTHWASGVATACRRTGPLLFSDCSARVIP